MLKVLTLSEVKTLILKLDCQSLIQDLLKVIDRSGLGVRYVTLNSYDYGRQFSLGFNIDMSNFFDPDYYDICELVNNANAEAEEAYNLIKLFTLYDDKMLLSDLRDILAIREASLTCTQEEEKHT